LLHAIGLGLSLMATWLLLSGYFEPLLLSLGVASCLLVVWLAHRMAAVDRVTVEIDLGWRIVPYWLWLLAEIVKANLDVARRVLDPKLPISPTLVRVKTRQTSDLGRVIFANSITLTPGTVSLDYDRGEIVVHALSEAAADDVAAGEMNRRVAALARPDRGN